MCSWICRLDNEIGPFEKRHGRRKRTRVPGQRGDVYEQKDAPRLKKIDPRAASDLFDGDIAPGRDRIG